MEIWNLTLFTLEENEIFYNSYRSMQMRDASGYKDSYITPTCEEYQTVNKIG